MQTIEVFKTNISCPHQARMLIEKIHTTFAGYQANFDLDDCDKVLRIVSTTGLVTVLHFINWLKTHECHAEILPDN